MARRSPHALRHVGARGLAHHRRRPRRRRHVQKFSTCLPDTSAKATFFAHREKDCQRIPRSAAGSFLKVTHVENHTYSHPAGWWWAMPRPFVRREIERGIPGHPFGDRTGAAVLSLSRGHEQLVRSSGCVRAGTSSGGLVGGGVRWLPCRAHGGRHQDHARDPSRRDHPRARGRRIEAPLS